MPGPQILPCPQARGRPALGGVSEVQMPGWAEAGERGGLGEPGGRGETGLGSRGGGVWGLEEAGGGEGGEGLLSGASWEQRDQDAE